MEDEKITAWVTRYALTDGIFEIEGYVLHEISSGTFSYQREGSYTDFAHGKDWHRTREAAVARAEEMRAAKIKSLEKSIEKMKKLDFSK